METANQKTDRKTAMLKYCVNASIVFGVAYLVACIATKAPIDSNVILAIALSIGGGHVTANGANAVEHWKERQPNGKQ